MIKTNDLRVNNYLLEQGRICWVSKIYKDKFSVFTKQGRRTSKLVEPIPLTSEWWDKCGAVIRQRGDNTVYQLAIPNATLLLYIHDGKYFFSPYEVNFQIEIKYVHQLQNLYYALTGIELEFKIDKNADRL